MADDSKDKPLMDFGSLDSVMMLMIYGASNLIDSKLSVEGKADLLAQFYAKFLGLRAKHEQEHIKNRFSNCPFCMSLELSLAMNRDV